VQVGSAPANGACLIEDSEGLAAKRYDARPGTCYLLRPDQHVCARWRAFELGAVRAAIARASAQPAQAAKAAA
jgi:3-(3-hydroxy-phenyl)propionate hydroxylase